MVIRRIKQKAELFMFDQVKKKLYNFNLEKNPGNKPMINQQYKYAMGRNMMDEIKRKIIND